MKSEEIKKLVEKSENAAVEFKRAKGGVPADFWPSYSAFANTDGGTVILGIREKDGKREVEGLANTETFFSLVRIGERSGMGLSSLYGTWEKEHFAEPSIFESYEPDRTKVIVEFEADESEVGVKKQEVREKTSEVREKTSEVREKRLGSEGENLGSEDANSDFEVLMGAYRNDFRENARKILSAIADDQEIDTTGLTQKLGISEASVWRAIRAMKEVGLLVREGGDKGGKWIVKK